MQNWKTGELKADSGFLRGSDLDPVTTTERVTGKIVICQSCDEYADSAGYTCECTGQKFPPNNAVTRFLLQSLRKAGKLKFSYCGKE